VCVCVCVLLPCVGRGIAVSRFPVQGVLPKCLKGFKVSEVIRESVKAEGPNPNISFR